MIRKMKRIASMKLRCQRGETITEVLVSTLIAGLALLMLATVIATAAHMVHDSREKMSEYYEQNNAAATSGAISFTGDVSVTQGASTVVYLKDGTSSLVADYYLLGEADEGTPAVSYRLRG